MSSAPLHSAVLFRRDPDLPDLEAREACYRREAFRPHTHEAVSVGLIRAGSTRFLLRGRSRAARAGQIVVIPARAPHACNPDPGAGLDYRMFYLAPALLAGAADAACGLPAFPPVLDDPELFAAWDGLYAAMAGGAPREEKQAKLAACLRGLLLRRIRPETPGAVNPAVERALRRIAASHGVFVPLDELAAAAGLSRCHFLRVFTAAIGLPPHRYQMQRAVERAKALLAGGAPISQAALEAGFADQSHFSRRFREFTGATPGQYADAPPRGPAQQ